MKKILVAVDGSKCSDKAVLRAKKLGAAFESEITIVNVVEDIVNPESFSLSYTVGHAVSIQKELGEQSEELLSDYMEEFKDYEGEVNNLSITGKAANEIIKIANDGEYDLVVVGSRGLGAFASAMLGCVSNKIAHKAKMSVLIIK